MPFTPRPKAIETIVAVLEADRRRPDQYDVEAIVDDAYVYDVDNGFTIAPDVDVDRLYRLIDLHRKLSGVGWRRGESP